MSCVASGTSRYEQLSLHIKIDCGFGIFSENFMDFTYFIQKIPDSWDENSPNPHNVENVENFFDYFQKFLGFSPITTGILTSLQ
jgi:hypothetical protein